MPNLYDGPIIDPHHHLWDLTSASHPWLTAAAAGENPLGDVAPLLRDYLVDDYLADTAGQNVVASVHIEAGWRPDDPLGETRWLELLAAGSGVAACYVAHVPLADPDAPRLIDEQAAVPKVVGVRDILSWHSDPARSFASHGDLMDLPDWQAGLAHLGRRGLGFDLMIFPGQMAQAARLTRKFPDQLFVLNHCGSPIDRDPESLARWRSGLAALAEAPNVRVKISDLVAYDHHWTLDSLRAVVLRCIDCFGPERSMFGTDFPVAKLHATAAEVFDSFRTIVADFSADEQHALFFETARQTYRVPVEG